MTTIQKIKDYVSPKQYIHTPEGVKFAANLKVGDIVFGEKEANTIEKIEIIREKWAYIDFNNGAFSFYKNQTVWVNGNWKHAFQIEIGDFIKNEAGVNIRIDYIKKVNKTLPYYRLDISGDHTYYINGILVHNATRYWVGGSAHWDNSKTNWSASSGGAGGATKPTIDDDVIIDLHSNEPTDAAFYIVTDSATSICRNLTISFTGTTQVTFYSDNLQINGSLNLSGGSAQVIMSGSVKFYGTGTGKTITTNGVTISQMFFMEAGSWTISDTLTVTSGIYIKNGTITANAKTITAGSIEQYVFGTATLDITNSTITCAGWNFGTSAGMTLTTTGSSITVNANTFTGGGFTYATVAINPTTNLALSGANTFTTLTITGNTAYRTLTLAANQIITGTLTLNGNSAANRLFISSSVLGTVRTITADVLVTQYTDWQDITAAGDANWDLTDQAIDNFGDLGHNTGITFTTATDQHWTNVNGGNWSDVANWTSRVPLPQDDVFMDCAFGTDKIVTADVSILGKNIDWTGATWTTSLTLTSSMANKMYGSLTLISGLTYTSALPLQIYADEDATITSHGVVFGQKLMLYAFGTAVIYLGDNINTTLKGLYPSFGTFSCVNGVNNYNVTTLSFYCIAGTTVILGSGTHEITGVGSSSYFIGTVNAGTSTIKITNTANQSKYFTGGSNTFYNLWIAIGTGVSEFAGILGSNTFNDLKIEAGITCQFENGSTQHVTTFTAVGTSGSVITLKNSSGTTAFHLSKTSGMVICDYLNISFSDATGGAIWLAGSHSTNTIGNSGWRFVDLLTKELTEVIKVVPTLVRTRFKEMTESIKGVSNLATLNGLFCNETINIVLIFFAPFFKVLTQIIKVIPTYTRVPGWYKVYTERVIVTPTLAIIKALKRTYSEVVKVVSTRLNQTGKTFTQRVVVVPSMVKATGRILTQIINVISAKTSNSARVLAETVKITPVYDRVITSYKEFVETVKVFGEGLNTTGREFIESISIPAEVMETINTFNAVFTEVIKMFTNIIHNTSETRPLGNEDNPWQKIASNKDGSILIACDSDKHLFISQNHGASWDETFPADPVITSYSNPGGKGNRTSLITIDSNIEVSSGEFPILINGIKKTDEDLYFSVQDVDESLYLQFDFGEGASKVITEARYYQSNFDSQGTWQWQGSNDNENWDNIGSPFELGNDMTQVITELSGNTSGYRYYQLVGVSGNIGGGSQNREFEFKIGNFEESYTYNWLNVSVDYEGQTILASNANAQLFITFNGGTSWSELIPNPIDPNDYVKVVISGYLGFILVIDAAGYVYQSNDFGENWVERTGGTFQATYLTMSLDGYYGAVVGTYSQFYITSDWLQTIWFGDPTGEGVFTPQSYTGVSLSYDGRSCITCVSGKGVYVSNELFNNFHEVFPAGDVDLPWAGVKISGSGTTLMAWTSPGRMYISRDFGVTWSEFMPMGDTDQYWSGVAMNSNASQIEAMIYDGRIYQITKSDGNLLYDIGREFGEVITAISSVVNVGVLNALLEEVITVGESFLRSIGSVYVETIKVFSISLQQTARIFGEVIKVVQNKFEAIGAKVMTEIVSVVPVLARQLIWTRQFTETIIANWAKLTFRSKTYIERIVVRPVNVALVATKVLLERIVGRTTWLFRKTIHAELTDVIKASGSLLNSTTRVFTEIVKMTGSLVFETARVFTETLSVVTDFLASYSKILLETIKIPSLNLLQSWVIGKLLSEVITIRLVFTEGRQWVMTETVKVVSGLANSTGRVLNETITAVDLLTRSIGRTLSQVVKMASTVEFTHTLYKVLSESLKASGGAIKSVGKTFTQQVKIIGAMGENVIAKLIKEAVKLTDYSLAVFTREFVEVIKVSANAVIAWSITLVETISIVGSFILGTISKLLIETVKIGQIFSQFANKVLIENLSVVSDMLKQGGKVLLESIVISGTFVIDSISKVLIETVKVIGEFTKAWTASRVYSETIKVAGAVTKQAGRIFTQVVKVVQPAPVVLFTLVLTQIVKVGDSVTRTMTRIFSEVVKVVLVFSNQMNLVFTNVIKVVSSMGNFAIAKLFIENITFKLNKTRLLLNGIQVGLWKKVARVTNGVWKKISRNDN